jgi:hypothetical protein
LHADRRCKYHRGQFDYATERMRLRTADRSAGKGKKTMLRSLSTLCVAVVFGLSLAACGGGETTTPEVKPPPKEEPAPPKEEATPAEAAEEVSPAEGEEAAPAEGEEKAEEAAPAEGEEKAEEAAEESGGRDSSGMKKGGTSGGGRGSTQVAKPKK